VENGALRAPRLRFVDNVRWPMVLLGLLMLACDTIARSATGTMSTASRRGLDAHRSRP